LEAVHSGEVVISEVEGRARSAPGLDWPGRGEGLSEREAEVLALITQGMSNADVARLTYLSPNTVKSYIRTIYRKLGVGSRTQAMLWGVNHGFTPDHHRIEHWRGGP
jgi:DNA-binding NarL/FixJ family response regulator